MIPVIASSCFARGATTAVAALIASLLGIGSLVMNVPSGILANRVGERRAMLAAAGMTVLGLTVCIPDLGRGAGSLACFGFGVLLIGAAGSVFQLARQAYLTEIVPLRMRARALSMLGGTWRLGLFAGPFLAAGAVALWGLGAAYCVSLVAVLVAGLVVHRGVDLDLSVEHRDASAQLTTRNILTQHGRVFLTLGTAVLLLCAIRQTRQTVIPLWANHIGLSASSASLIYGVAGAVDALTFYPAGKVMDLYGRRVVAAPSACVLGASFVLMPLTHGAGTLMLVAMIMGFGNGIGSGLVMTMAADVSPRLGRNTFLGVWRELEDVGTGIGPLILSGVTAIASLGAGLAVSGGVGFLAAAALWAWAPKNMGTRRRNANVIPAIPAPSLSDHEWAP